MHKEKISCGRIQEQVCCGSVMRKNYRGVMYSVFSVGRFMTNKFAVATCGLKRYFDAEVPNKELQPLDL
jgi:hypothetical protein